MFQNKLVRDRINYVRHGVRYAMEQIDKEYRCQKCGLKHSNTESVINCCKKN